MIFILRTIYFNNISIIFKINNGMFIMIINSLIDDIDDLKLSFIIYLNNNYF